MGALAGREQRPRLGVGPGRRGRGRGRGARQGPVGVRTCGDAVWGRAAFLRRTIVIKVMKCPEFTALARAKGFPESGHPSGLLPVFAALPRAKPLSEAQFQKTVRRGEWAFLPGRASFLRIV